MTYNKYTIEYDKLIKVFDYNKIVQMCDPFVGDCVEVSEEARGIFLRELGLMVLWIFT